MKKNVTFQPEATVGFFVIASLVLFVYFSLYVGVARLDMSKYAPYTVCVENATGIAKKTEVRIAGIAVGWVNDFKLLDGGNVEVKLRISKRCLLHVDASVKIAQDGMFGPRYLDLALGSSEAPLMKSGGMLTGGGSAQLSLDDISKTAERLAETAAEVGELFTASENGIGRQLVQIVDEIPQSLQEFRIFLKYLRPTISATRDKIYALADELHDETLPEMRQKIEHVLETVETTAQKMTKQVDAVQRLQETIIESESFKAVSTSIINVIKTTQLLGWGADTYTEFLTRRTTPLFEHPNFKVHVNAFLTHPDYFVLGGFTFSRYGFIKRRIVATEELTDCLDSFGVCKRIKEIQENKFGINLQLGTRWHAVSARFGIFESKLGVALDVEMPFLPDRFRWVVTGEVFDFSGANHIVDDSKPHLKIINRLFFSPGWYVVAGIDDVASAPNRSAFFGFGIQF